MAHFSACFTLALAICSLSQPAVRAQIAPQRNVSSDAALEGIVFFSYNNGLSWENKSDGLLPATQLGLGAIAASGDQLAVLSGNAGVYLFDVKRDTWVLLPGNKQLIESKPGTLTFFKNQMFVGTQSGGVFISADNGKHWLARNAGLENRTIRKLVPAGDVLYAGTNAGLYSYNEQLQAWKAEFMNSTLQVNGIAEFAGDIYIGTNQGVFCRRQNSKTWTPILADRAVHNISADDQTIYAMVYNELLASIDKGASWKNIQKGLPAHLYTFNVVKHGDSVFAGQWDGVYTTSAAGVGWQKCSNGLPENFAITNMKSLKGIIVVSGSGRKLKDGMTTDK